MSCHSISWTDCTDPSKEKQLEVVLKNACRKPALSDTNPISTQPVMAYITMKVSRVTRAAMRQISIRCFPMLAWRDHELFE